MTWTSKKGTNHYPNTDVANPAANCLDGAPTADQQESLD